MIFEKPKIDGDVKITHYEGFTIYEYFELSNVHGRIYVIEVCYNARPSQIFEDEFCTRIRKTCVTDKKLEDLSTIEYKTPSNDSDNLRREK